MSLSRFLFVIVAVTIWVSSVGAEDQLSGRGVPAREDDALLTLRRDNARLQEKINMLEALPRLDRAALTDKSYRGLREIAANVRMQRQTMADFEGFVRWMSANLSGYAKYIEAGSFAAGFAKVLPIPYAGEASVLTKFISRGVLSLNAASVSIARYLTTSQQFLARVEAIDRARSAGGTGEIAEAARFAEGPLLRDMNDVRAKLAATAELSTSMLSFLESLNHYAAYTDGYWNKTKSLVTRREIDKKEKSYLSQSILGLKNRTGSFNGRLKLFDEATRKDEPLIKSLSVYDELSRELEVKKTAQAAGR